MNIRFFQFSFVDLFGVQRSKLVPAKRVADIAADGAGFAGFAAHLDMDPTMGDLLAVPDASTLAVLPWQPEVGWISCNLVHEGVELAHGPRNVLRAVQAKLAAEYGLALKTGVECEFFLLDGAGAGTSGAALSDHLDVQSKPCYDAHALMRRYETISTLMSHMEELGWGPYQAGRSSPLLLQLGPHRCCSEPEAEDKQSIGSSKKQPGLPACQRDFLPPRPTTRTRTANSRSTGTLTTRWSPLTASSSSSSWCAHLQNAKVRSMTVTGAHT